MEFVLVHITSIESVHRMGNIATTSYQFTIKNPVSKRRVIKCSNMIVDFTRNL
jgi:hypothetical protein